MNYWNIIHSLPSLTTLINLMSSTSRKDFTNRIKLLSLVTTNN